MQLDRLLIYVSPVTWKSFKQRSHEMVAYCRGEGYERIVWIEPYPVRLPSIWDWRRPRNRSNQLSNQGTVSEKVTITSLPIEPVPGLRAINSMLWRRNLKKLNDELAQARDSRLIIGKPSGFALALLNLGVLGGTLYDAMDNFPDFYTGLSRRYMADLEAKIVTRVDKVLTTTHCIRDRLQGLSSDIDVVPNGLATDVFSSESTSLITERHKESERVVVGYVGTIGRWFDWNLLIAFAQTCPEVEFRIVGPVFVPWYGILPRNILLMGELQHADAMNELARFDIGLIPFMQNSLTAG
ncbi:MAG: glycosyl transferase, partial [Gammaproteobacteria bacterium]|nr:glycosyl transferase [Gammaproteobacteria bacterium]